MNDDHKYYKDKTLRKNYRMLNEKTWRRGGSDICEKVKKIIHGALKTCIDTHGDITKTMLSSATKRVAKQLLAAENIKITFIKDDKLPDVAAEIEKWIFENEIIISKKTKVILSEDIQTKLKELSK